MLLLLFIVSFFIVDALRFSKVDDVLPTNISSDSHILTISKDDLLVVLDLNTNYVILGGRNAAYNISLWDVNIRHTISWPTNNATQHECSMIISSVCDNFIRSYYQLQDGFVLCGTHGQRPMCKRFTGGWDDPYPVETFPGEGLSPFTPVVNAPFVNADGRIFTANAPEYSQSADAIWLRKTVTKKEKAIRTARGESAFDSAQFVAMGENGQDVLAFFNELPTDGEGCGLRKVARVGRVCKDDPGAISFPDEWSSFVKARLECSVTEEGYDSLLFNQLTSLVGSDGLFVGVFRSQLAGLGFSAICLFPRETVSSTLASPFASKSGSCPRATSDALQRNLRGNPLIQQNVKTAPVFVYSGKEDVVAMAVQHNVTDLSGLDYTIVYLGTTRGRVFKVVIGGGGPSRHVVTLVPLSTVTPVKGLWLRQERLANQKTSTSLFVLSESSVTKAPTTTCSHAANCSACLSMGDPQCAWILHGAECVTVEENHFRREYLTQQVAKCPRAPPPVAEVKKNLAALPCLCQKAEPCVTQVIQKELQPIISSEGAMSSLFFLSIGLLVGALLNCLCIRSSNVKGSKEDDIIRPTRLDAYAKSPVLRQSPRASMHSSIHTYC